MSANTFHYLFESIIEQELCTSCGLCESVCPHNLIRMSDESVPLPVVQLLPSEIMNACGECRLCSQVCPGFDTGAITSERRIFGRTRREEERWIGIYEASYQLSSINPRIASAAAAGGAGTSLGVVALKEGLVDAMLVVGRDEAKPWIPRAYLTHSIEKVIECAQSSYCLTPTLHLLDNQAYEKIGIIGVPCQIQAIQKLLNDREHPQLRALANKIVFTMEIGCASSTSLEGTEHLITNLLGLRLEDVAEMRYRHGEYPGQFMVRTMDGVMHTLPFFKLVEEFKRFKTFRCLSCPDWWSGLGDISIADGDPDIYSTSKSKASPAPTSTVLVRSQAGRDLLELAVRTGMIRLQEYEFVTNLGLERKKNRYRYYMSRQERTIPLPPVDELMHEDILTDDEVIERGVKFRSR
jgi:coenzyme F420 hydrogenase subunit beta